VEVVFFGKALALFARIKADADDLRVLLLVFIGEVPEPGTLCRSARGVGFREEPEHDFLPPQIAEAQRFAMMIGGLEIGGGLARLQHAGSSED
jgi:hypothetical protein